MKSKHKVALITDKIAEEQTFKPASNTKALLTKQKIELDKIICCSSPHCKEHIIKNTSICKE